VHSYTMTSHTDAAHRSHGDQVFFVYMHREKTVAGEELTKYNTHTHTHTHTYIYIYIYIWANLAPVTDKVKVKVLPNYSDHRARDSLLFPSVALLVFYTVLSTV